LGEENIKWLTLNRKINPGGRYEKVNGKTKEIIICNQDDVGWIKN